MARMGFIQDEMDLKLLVLYIMARIAAPITFLQLLELALCDAGVDYFSLTQAVEASGGDRAPEPGGGALRHHGEGAGATARSVRAACHTRCAAGATTIWCG